MRRNVVLSLLFFACGEQFEPNDQISSFNIDGVVDSAMTGGSGGEGGQITNTRPNSAGASGASPVAIDPFTAPRVHYETNNERCQGIRERARTILNLQDENAMEEIPTLIHVVWVGSEAIPTENLHNLREYLRKTDKRWTIKVWSDRADVIKRQFYALFTGQSGDLSESSRLEFLPIESLMNFFRNDDVANFQDDPEIPRITFDKEKILRIVYEELIGFGEPRAVADTIRLLAIYIFGGYAMNFNLTPTDLFFAPDVVNRRLGGLVINEGKVMKIMAGLPGSLLYAAALLRLSHLYDAMPMQSQTSIEKRTPSRARDRRNHTIECSGCALSSAVQALKGTCQIFAPTQVRGCWELSRLLGSMLLPIDEQPSDPRIRSYYIAGGEFVVNIETTRDYVFSQERIRSFDDRDVWDGKR